MTETTKTEAKTAKNDEAGDDAMMKLVTVKSKTGKPKTHKEDDKGYPACKAKVKGEVTHSEGTLSAVTCTKCRGETTLKLGPPTSEAKDEIRRQQLRFAVHFAYDLQQMRIMQGNRAGPQAEHAQALLDETQRTFMQNASLRIGSIEKDAFKEVERLLTGVPIWERWLKHQKGVGPTIGGVIVSSIDIHKNKTVAGLWALAGLAVMNAHRLLWTKGKAEDVMATLKKNEVGFIGELTDVDRRGYDCVIDLGETSAPFSKFREMFGDRFWLDMTRGEAQRRKKGERAHYDPWLKAKMLHVLGGGLLKANNATYRKVYDDYRHRKNNEIGTCMLCMGTKKYDEKPCGNCQATGTAPWGKSDAHRHEAAIRRMVKEFIRDLWENWRTIEGLPIRERYETQYLGRKHHAVPEAAE